MRSLPPWLPVLAGLACGALLVALLPAHALFTAAPVAPLVTTGTSSPPTARYACPMLCTITGKPGACPVCGMTLTAITTGELQPEVTRRMGLETTRVATGPATATVRAHGTADYDHRFTKLVIPRVAGRIVARHDATFGCCEVVAAGAPIIDLYSETVIAAQAELQAALKLDDTALTAALRDRFARWNLTPVADAIADGGPVLDIITITSPFAGSVLLADEDMVNETLFVGREITPDTPLLQLVDPDKLVLIVHVPETRANWIRTGQSVAITSDDAGPLPQIAATVGRVTDEINPSLRAREVRIHLEGARDVLSPGSLVGARFEVALGPDLRPADPLDRATWGEFVLIPKTAVLSTGVRNVAWRLANPDASGPARFELAPLALGPRLENENGRDHYVVRAGLTPGDVVATQGAFLIDSQAQLAGTPSLLHPLGASTPAPAHQH